MSDPITKNEEKQFVVFQLSKETYGVDIGQVSEIITMQQITKVPHTIEFIEGIINLRGRVIPVVDLRKRFGLPCDEITRNTRIVVIEIGGNTLGMIVDGVSEVLRISGDIVEAPPPAITNVDADYLEGVAKLEDRLIILLNLEKVLTKQEQAELENMVN
ncbi:MAG TPA: chemotaxis protein CheW [Bacillota bacterium]|nr:chemotaxis protein CheW [Bacillota bacterium]